MLHQALIILDCITAPPIRPPAITTNTLKHICRPMQARWKHEHYHRCVSARPDHQQLLVQIATCVPLSCASSMQTRLSQISSLQRMESHLSDSGAFKTRVDEPQASASSVCRPLRLAAVSCVLTFLMARLGRLEGLVMQAKGLASQIEFFLDLGSPF